MYFGGAEALVAQRQAAERRQQRRRVPLHRDVELARRRAEQQVAHRAADQVHASARWRGAQQRRAAGHGPEAVAQIGQRGRTIYHQVAMSPRRRKRLWWLVAGAVVALLLAGAAAAVVVMRSGE